MKVQLVRPPLDKWYEVNQLGENISHPTGLHLLRSVLKKEGIDAEVIDGYFKTMPEVLPRVGGADFVGVTSMYSNYENALTILGAAKNSGARTIIGGANVTHLAKRILTNRPFIDFAVVNDGEEALPQIVRGEAGEMTPNLVYRNNNGRAVESLVRRNAPLTTVFDLEGIAEEDKWQPLSIPVSGIRGCIKANTSGLCDFCSIDHKLKVMDPTIMWKQVRVLKEYGLDYLWEIGETAFPGYLDQLLRSRPKDLSGTRWKFYMCADLIDENTARTLKELGTREIMMGIETPNDLILERIGKKSKSEDIERAFELLYKFGINIHGAAMYGLTGETPETAQRTFEFTQGLMRKYPNLVKLVTSHAVPLFGTKMFKRLAENPEISSQYLGDLNKDDCFNYRELTELYVKHFTSVTIDLTDSLVEKTRRLMEQRGYATSFEINPVGK